jgi:hypothetical protein
MKKAGLIPAFFMLVVCKTRQSRAQRVIAVSLPCLA